jgi:GNAT superfamily N-acetyltransferase
MGDDLRQVLYAALLAPPLPTDREGPLRYEAQAGLVMTASDASADPASNQALVFEALTPGAFFAWTGAFFRPEESYCVTIEAGVATEIEDTLRQRGWELEHEEPALVLAHFPTAIPQPPAELTIALVADERTLADYRAITRMAPQTIPSLAAATTPDVALLVGYVEGEPVATGRLSRYGAVAEINSVTTAPLRQRKGYGTAISWAAIAEGARRGCSSAMLTATEMGKPVYVRMGFQQVATFRTYVMPPV